MSEKNHCFIWPVYRGLVGCVLVALSNSLWAQLPAEALERLSAFLPGINATMVEPSAFPGAYQIKYGLDVYYVSADGDYLMAGNLIDLSTGRNLTEESRKSARLEVIDQIDPQEKIIFPAKDQKQVITVFTDVGCTYCQKLHREVGQLNAAGVSVEYLAFPRGGLESRDYDKMVSVWCAKNPNQAITDAKRGKTIARARCDNPVADQYQLGLTMQVKGTPTIVLPDGELLGGYVPAAELISMLEKNDD